MNILIHASIRYDSLRFEECIKPPQLLAVGPAPGVVAVASMELVLLAVAMVTDHSRRRRRSRRRWPIKQISQIVLQLQVRARSPRHSLNGQIRPPVADDGSSGHRVGTFYPPSSAVGFVLHVELAQGVHQGAVLVLPALLQQCLGRNVVQIVCAGGGFVSRDSGRRRSEIKSIFFSSSSASFFLNQCG